MPEGRKAPIAASVANVRGWAKALFEEPTPLKTFSTLMSPSSTCSAPIRPRPRITHPDTVNAAIARFLEETKE